jgi:uncharacterized protein (DUF736 family)
MIQQPTLTKQWAHWSGTLQTCVQKATRLYSQTHEEQGKPVWRVFVPGLEMGRGGKDEQQDAHLWVFAKLYLEGKQEPVALISHIDFEG